MNATNPENELVKVPGELIPSFKTSLAYKNGLEKNILINVWGGLGDLICAEPTLRYALDTYSDCRISLATSHPELFSHLSFHKVYDSKTAAPAKSEYLIYETAGNPQLLVGEFLNQTLTHCVDYPALIALRSQLPLKYRRVCLPTPEPEEDLLVASLLERDDLVVVHPGKHWPSKTFPKDWWDAVLQKIISAGATPLLIGSAATDTPGTVDVNSEGCIDLRNYLRPMDAIAFLQRTKVLLTNDSAPLHMAATGNAWIGFIATCKHPDFITHYRESGWAWRMQDFSTGGVWTLPNPSPNESYYKDIVNIEEDVVRSWLPEPESYAQWALEKL